MVKIIKSGVCTYIKTCPKCHCEFSYELNDLIEGTGVDGIYIVLFVIILLLIKPINFTVLMKQSLILFPVPIKEVI